MTATIQNKYVKFQVAQTGGSIVSGHLFTGNEWIPFMPDTSHMVEKLIRKSSFPAPLTSRDELHESMFIMAPYSNRIKNGDLKFAGQTKILNRNTEHSLHGDLWHRNTRILSHCADRLELEYVMEDCPINWPHPFTAKITYSLSEIDDQMNETNKDEKINDKKSNDKKINDKKTNNGNAQCERNQNLKYVCSLTANLILTNTSCEPTFLGGGFHPYFLKNLQIGRQGRLKANVHKRLETVETGISKTGKMIRDHLCASLNHGIELNEGAPYIDDCFSHKNEKQTKKDLRSTQLNLIDSEDSFTPSAKVDYGDVKLEIQHGKSLDHLVIYNPEKPYFAVEPVSHKNGDIDFNYVSPLESVVLQFKIVIVFHSK